MQVREALRNTANNSSAPNNVYGWGLINAYKAILYFGEVWGTPLIINGNGKSIIRIGFASNDFTSASVVKFNYRTQNSKKFKSAEMVMVKPFENGNYSGVYECELPNPNNTNITFSDVEYNFSVTINGKEIKYKGSK
jgi:hypothetical protein